MKNSWLIWWFIPTYWAWTTVLFLTLWTFPSFPEVSSVRKDYLHKNISDLLDNLLRGYDNSIRPDFGGAPMEVEINLMVRSMGPISEVDMTYSMDMYFRQSWIDKRLSYSANKATLALSISMLEKIWKPDTYFYNGKQSYLHTITTPNKFVRLYQDGRVLYSSRLTVKASCPMHLEDFPMDTQRCPLKIGSFGYTTRDVIYRWKKGNPPVDIASDMKMSQFDLISTPSGNATDTLKSGERSVLEAYFYLRRHTGYFLLQVYFPCILLVAVSWVSFWINREATADRVTLGQYSCLLVNFYLQRHMGNFLIQVYGPCTLLVVLSWVSFWLNREATADRVSLGVTTVLTMTFLGLEARTDLPKVPYPTALDFFVFLSFAFIFATIIQFAVVHYFTKNGSGEIYFNDTSSSSDDSDDENKNERGRPEDEPSSSSQPYGIEMGIGFRPNRSGCSSTAPGAATPMGVGILPYQQMSIIEMPPPLFPSQPLKINNGSGLGSGSGEDSPSVIPGCPQTHAQPRNPHLHHHQNPDSHHHRHSSRRESTWSFCAKAARKRRKKLREKQRLELENVNSVSKVDKFARIFFPASFICINVFYWYSYLYKGDGMI